MLTHENLFFALFPSLTITTYWHGIGGFSRILELKGVDNHDSAFVFFLLLAITFRFTVQMS